MAFVSGAVPNVIGGVSQQPAEIRQLNCSTSLTNTWSDVASGLSTRPAGTYVGTIGPKPLDGSTVATHVINKATGDYHITIQDGTIKVIRIDGDTPVPQVVTVESGADSYLAGADAAANMGFVTVGDTTFVYNRSITVAKTPSAEGTGLTGLTDEGILRRNPNRYGSVWIKQKTAFNSNFTVYYNNVQAANVVSDQSPRSVRAALSDALIANGYAATRVAGSQISIQMPSEGDSIVVSDDFADQAMSAFNESIEEFTDLPNVDIIGRMVMVRGGIEENADDYWVWNNGSRWIETFGWNAYESINANTMPVLLYHEGGNAWTLKRTVWPGREVGDADSNPTPSFVGRTIRSMFLYKGRMVILSDENFIASRVNNFENYYRQTCTQLLDDDPIDLASANSRGAPLNFAKEFDGNLLLFSEYDQFRISADSEGLLSPNTVNIKKVNSYNNSRLVEPGFIGPNIAFVDDFGSRGFAALREYQVERVFGTEVAHPITDAVPEYIPSGVFKLVGSSTYSNLVIATRGDRRKLWLYNYYFNNEGKVVSAWQDWSYTGDVYSIDYSRDRLLVVVEYDGDLHILQHVFDAGADTKLDKASILLDFGLNEAQVVRTKVGNDTWVTLPFDVDPDDEAGVALVVSPSTPGAAVAAQTYLPAAVVGGVLTFRNVDLTGSCEFVVGFRFQFRWKVSPVYMRDGNQVAIQDGKLQLRRMSFLYNYSGPFQTEFTPIARQTYVSRYTGVTLGAAGDALGQLSLDSGEFKVAVNGPGELMDLWVTGWTPWRVRFSTLEWEGSFRPKKRRT